MAKLKVLPHQDIIDGFKGKVDFYIYHSTCDPSLKGPGIPVARKWPRSPGHLRAQAVMDQWADFSYAAGAWNLLSQEVQDAYRALAVGSGLSGRDLFARSYLSGLYRYDHEVPAPPIEIDIGPAAIDRATRAPSAYTFIAKENPANADGALHLVALFGALLGSGLVLATFYQVAENTFTTRSHQDIGAFPVGYSEHEVSLNVVEGDYIGCYYSGGGIDRDNIPEGYWYKTGLNIPCTNELFTFSLNRTISLYGTGD